MLRPVRLVIVRHAEAASGEPDELRPLTPEGRRTARALGQRLADEGLHPDAVLTSPLLRARETAQELARPAGLEAEPDDRLAPGATPESVRAAAGGRGETVIVVGHQPDCSRIAAALSGGEEPVFAPGAMRSIELS
jgi:phosphohistidine phosphatase